VVGGLPFAERLNGVLDDLVHRSVRPSDAGFAAHRWFIGSRLALGLLGLGPVVFWLALPEAMPRLVLQIGAALCFQLFMAMSVSRLGGLRAGFTGSVLGFAGFAVMAAGPLGPFIVLPFMMEGAILTGRSGTGLAALSALTSAAAAIGVGRLPMNGGLLAIEGWVMAALFLGSLYWAARETKRTARARLSDDRWRTLSGLTDDGIVRHDESGTILGSNAMFCQLLGILPDELADKTVIRRLHLGSGPAFLKALSDVSHGAGLAVARVRLQCDAGAKGHSGPDPYRDFEVRFSRAVYDSKTAHSEIMACYRPVAPVVDQALIEQKPSLEAARLGHELRTPLTAIIGFAECLSDPTIIAANDPKRGDYARIIGTSARHMLDLVNHLPGARFEGASEAELEPIDVAEVVDEAVGMMRLTIEAQRAELNWEVEDDVPALNGSRHAFRQILINLISNALKFAPEGAVFVRAVREGDKIRLTVEDNGVGVAHEDVARLGEAFFRGSASGAGAPSGQGLGLGIVRDIVQRHHGHFDVMSRQGAGTRVIITFAVPQPARQSEVKKTEPEQAERRYA
jgi:cell cycle sensor histidine kinase DivJ